MPKSNKKHNTLQLDFGRIIILGSLRYILLIILFTMSILYQNKTVGDPTHNYELKNHK